MASTSTITLSAGTASAATTLSRRAMFSGAGTLAAAVALGSIAAPGAAAHDTVFARAATAYRAAEKRFNRLPHNLELHDPAAYEREEQAYHDALDTVDQTPVASWAEFSEAFEIACDGGSSLPGDELVLKLLSDVRKLAKGGLN